MLLRKYLIILHLHRRFKELIKYYTNTKLSVTLLVGMVVICSCTQLRHQIVWKMFSTLWQFPVKTNMTFQRQINYYIYRMGHKN